MSATFVAMDTFYQNLTRGFELIPKNLLQNLHQLTLYKKRQNNSSQGESCKCGHFTNISITWTFWVHVVRRVWQMNVDLRVASKIQNVRLAGTTI
jgi:hypothetical protein